MTVAFPWFWYLLSRYRKPLGAVIVGASVVLSSVAIYQTTVGGGGTPPGTANLFVDASGGTCTRSATPVPYNDAAACGSLDAAYDAAQCDDLVLVRSGDYGTDPQTQRQNISGDNTCGAGNEKVLQAYPSEVPFFPFIGLPDPGAACSGTGPDNLVLRGFKVKGIMVQNGTNTTIDQFDGGTFGMSCPQGLLIENSDWGPCNVGGAEGVTYQGENAECRHYYLNDNGDGKPHIWGGQNFTIRNNTFHGIFGTNGAHAECIQLNNGSPDLAISGTNRIDGNVWWDCWTNGISMGFYSTAIDGDLYIENNFFGCHHDGCTTLQMLNITSYPMDVNIYVRNNSFVSGAAFLCEAGCGNGTGNGSNVLSGNVFGRRVDSGSVENGNPCDDTSWTCDRNAWKDIGGTGPIGTNATLLSSLPYANDPQDPLVEPDLHLTGSNVGGVDNVSGLTCPSIDVDGQSRPMNATCDAGADERNQ